MLYRNRWLACSFGCPLKLTALLNCITASTLKFSFFYFCSFLSPIEFCMLKAVVHGHSIKRVLPR